MAHDPSLGELKKALGDKYHIKIIDFEKCLYRDFGNGFDVEISGCSRANHKGPATVYLWFLDSPGIYTVVDVIRDVERTPEAIEKAVELCYYYAEDLIKQGYDADRKMRFTRKFVKKEDL